MNVRKGIIMAGGHGTRLYPLTISLSKQLLPIYDKPMIFYPLSVLMLTGIREILIITTERDIAQFRELLSDGSQLGISIDYKVQTSPNGLAEAYTLGEEFLNGSPSAMILGDNVFYGNGLPGVLKSADQQVEGATVFGYHVSDPERYGIADFGSNGQVKSIIEKPKKPPSSYAITGLYFLDESAPDRARNVRHSDRGELEITSVLQTYLEDGILNLELMGRGYTWLDTGTHSTLLDAGSFVRTITERQGLLIGAPEEVAFQKKWIDKEQFVKQIKLYEKSLYGKYLERMLIEV